MVSVDKINTRQDTFLESLDDRPSRDLHTVCFKGENGLECAKLILFIQTHQQTYTFHAFFASLKLSF